jgi:two-component system, NtrC family, sensor kinase
MPEKSKKIAHLSKNLQERVKELSCLYEISKIAQKYAFSLDETLLRILKIIPKGWQYPDLLHVCIRIDDETYGAAEITKYKQRAPLIIDRETRGELVVFYTPETARLQKGMLFLKEEQQLINQVALEIASVIDRFEQRERERMLELKMRYNDRLNVLGELTAGIAHELNTPLGNILGYSELLQKSEMNPDKKADLRKIIASTLHAREIVKKLMYFSCEMPGQFNLINLNELILESLQLLNIQLRESNVTLDLRLSDKIQLLRLDSIQFSQVIFNLVLNAIAAMPSGGTLYISSLRKKEHVILKIKDTGIGIDKTNLVKLFQPFYTTKPSGTGLGLAVVHGIIQSHKGSITVASEKGKGTEFTLTLPQTT